MANINLPDPTESNPFVPQKLAIFVWWAKLNRLPVRSELDNRGIDLHSTRCPVCDDDVETLNHSLLTCKIAIDIWTRIRKWWNIHNPNITNLADISKPQNPYLYSITGSLMWQAVVWITSYYIWKNSNEHTFGHLALSSPKIISEIQTKSFEWIQSRWKRGNLAWQNWLLNPKIFDVDPVAKVGIG
ncbi:uncharacterized protein [Rutidosis leptorrhynchoides]|uniref:uncharacterized protein n=1 Tax=Rutidosis leptorrhynchoides TaxID=125765 RepID=UPI003A99BBDB